MADIFVIPDVHLKDWMFDKADELISKGAYQYVVLLGDLVDDFGQQRNIVLYEKTLYKALLFMKKHENSFLCWGNHDMSYLWGYGETGFSDLAVDTVKTGIKKIKSEIPAYRLGYIHKFDNILFSHAGVTDYFISKHAMYAGSVDDIINIVNTDMIDPQDLWMDHSPLWIRPQEVKTRMFMPGRYFQVVGHTPVEKATLDNKVLSVDTFSTWPDGRPIGDQTFLSINSVSCDYKIIEADIE